MEVRFPGDLLTNDYRMVEEMDIQTSTSSDRDVGLVCCDEERLEPKFKALYLFVCSLSDLCQDLWTHVFIRIS